MAYDDSDDDSGSDAYMMEEASEEEDDFFNDDDASDSDDGGFGGKGKGGGGAAAKKKAGAAAISKPPAAAKKATAAAKKSTTTAAKKPTAATTKPKAGKAPAKASTAAAKKSSKGSVMELDDDDDMEDDDVPFKPPSSPQPLAPKTANALNSGSKPAGGGGGSKKAKTIEETYQKKSQLEHILLRPDTYIGSTLRDTGDMYVLQNERIVYRTVQYTPGLYKIFDEIVVNAADNKQRDGDMDKLDISIDAATNTISVKNNGKGIPVQMHKEHGVYVPTLIFGHLLTGSNFDDDEKKTTGGRNGYGAKLANVFSIRFVVECVDSAQGVKFNQVFTDNMTKAHDPTIRKCTAAEVKAGDYVQITFSPDLKRFGMSSLDDDTVALLSKRAYDIAGTMASRNGKKLSVSLNGKKLPIKSFKDYLGLFDGLEAPVAFDKTDRWEVGVAPSNDASPHHVSFVNAICTNKGGGHVTYIADQVAAHLVKFLKKKKKKDVKPAQIKNHLTIYVNCLVENPSFDSQTKDFLTSKPKTFGSKFELPEKFLKTIEKSAIVNTIDSYLSFREREALKRKSGTKKIKLTGIAKLDDANFAGTAKSRDCTLIITEGDSAKSLAMAGLSVVGRDYYGVFPLRGKPLNVRDTAVAQVMKNEEIKNLVDIMGLKFNVTYDADSVKTLRYGHLMIMADQDTDGSHIKGLVINMIHHFWPSLLDVPGFLQQFITPIVKVTKGSRSISFFSLPEYQQWLESTGNGGKGYKIKYYKGLGTSTSAEAKEYFSSLDLHEVKFAQLSLDETTTPVESEDDGAMVPDKVSSGSDLIDMVFRKDRVSDRKDWLHTFTKETFLDYREVSEVGELKYSDFINKEYIIFSNYDNERSIPNIMDGFKPSQRKVLYACFKRKLKNEIKVAQLTGYVAEHSAYHHGEQSLQQTIVGLAQNFVGSNNVNLLTPSGQFGTRRMGGKDAASPRYIFTYLEPIARAIFHPDDDDLLTYLNDDGVSIEPEYYVPVIPMVLVNGSDGIGTGYSSAISNYCPREIISNLRRKLNGEQFVPMNPNYYGFEGDILPDDKKAGTFKVLGKVERIDETTLFISELPLKKWTQDYKQFLETMLTGGEKQPPEIKDFKENHTESTVRFTVTLDKEKLDEFEKDKAGLMGKFKLSSSLSTSNMNLFDPDKRIVKYATPEDIMTEFFQVRLDFYMKRKVRLVEKLEREQRMLSNKARFVEEVCSGALVVSNRKRKELLADLHERGYDTFLAETKKKAAAEANDDAADSDSEDDEVVSGTDLGKGYDYLLGMKIWSLTYEKAEKIRAELAEKTAELETLKATSPEQLWLNDLDAVEAALDQRDVQFAKSAKDEERAQKKNQKHQTNKKAAARQSKKKKDEWDSEMELSSDCESDDDASVSPPRARKPAAGRSNAATKKAKSSPVSKPKASTASAPAAKKAPLAAIAKAPSVPNRMMEVDSDSDVENKKPAAKKVKPVAASKKLVAKKAAIESLDDSDEDSVENMGLKDRLMSKKLAASPKSKPAPAVQAKKPTAAAKNAKKRPSPKNDEDDSDDDMDGLDDVDFVLASVTPAKGRLAGKASKTNQVAKKARSKAPAADVDLTAESDLDFHSDGDMAPPAKNRAPARARTGRAIAKQPVYNVDSDDESDGYGDDSDSE